MAATRGRRRILTSSRTGAVGGVVGAALVVVALALGGQEPTEFTVPYKVILVAGLVSAGAGVALIAAARQRTGRLSGGDRLGINALQLAALSALAIAQPLFDILSKNVEFFPSHRSSSLEVVAFALALVVGPPLAMLFVEAVVRLIREAALRWVHAAFIAGLAGLIALNALNELAGPPTALLLLVAALAAIAVGLGYLYFGPVRSFVTVLALAPAFFLASFLLSDDVSSLAFGEKEVESGPGAKRETPVVFAIFDEFAAYLLPDGSGRINSERFPNLARLSRDADWFPNSTTTADNTTQAVPALLTGRIPPKGTLPDAGDHPGSLFTLLGPSHRMRVYEETTRLCTDDCGPAEDSFLERIRTLVSDTGLVYRHLVLPPGMRDSLPPVNYAWADFGESGAVQAERFESFIRSIEPGEPPTVHFAHLLLPHIPWQFLPSGHRYERSDTIFGLSPDPRARWNSDEFLLFQAYQRQLLQAQYVDAQVGSLIERLRRAGLYDDALIVLTADHGSSIRPGGFRRELDRSNLSDIAGVPLLIKAPGQQEGRRLLGPVKLLDVIPTISELLDAPLPWKATGQSLAGGESPRRTHVSVSRGSDGKVFSVPFATFKRERDGAVAAMRRLVGDGAFPGEAGWGAYASMVGQPASSFARESAEGFSTVLDSQDAYRQVDPSTGTVPVFITGRLDGVPRGKAMDLAFVINGRIAAVGRSFAAGEVQAFSAMVAENALRKGENDVEVLAIEPGEKRPVLVGGA